MPKGPGLSFDFDLRPHPNAKRRAEEAPLRILVLADLAGRGSRTDARLGDLASRRPLAIDLDTLDAAFSTLAPELELAVDAEQTLQIGFEDLEAFHPDALFDRLGLFQEARGLRRRLADPATFAAAADDRREAACPVHRDHVVGGPVAEGGSQDGHAGGVVRGRGRHDEPERGECERFAGREDVGEGVRHSR